MKCQLLPIIFITFLVGVTGCSWLFPKDKYDIPTSLPPITERGANTFGCYINGDLMVSNGCAGRNCVTNPRFDPSLGTLVSAYRKNGNMIEYFININLRDIRREGMFILDTLSKTNHNTTSRSYLNVQKYINDNFSISTYDSGTYCRGQVFITKWQQGTVPFVSGTFWFDIYNPREFADTVRVREGRFDVSI